MYLLLKKNLLLFDIFQQRVYGHQVGARLNLIIEEVFDSDVPLDVSVAC